MTTDDEKETQNTKEMITETQNDHADDYKKSKMTTKTHRWLQRDTKQPHRWLQRHKIGMRMTIQIQNDNKETQDSH